MYELTATHTLTDGTNLPAGYHCLKCEDVPK